MGLLLVVSGLAHAQSGWSPLPLNNGVVVYAGPGFFVTDPLLVRSGQQPVGFYLGPSAGSNEASVRVNGGEWQSIDPGSTAWWADPPTDPGVYSVDFSYRGPGNPNENIVPFTLTVVPAATERFGDTGGNTMVFWRRSGTASNDKPFLMVEGIDAENRNSESTYYALASDLFSQAIAQGADVYVLNFNDGGRDLRLNADVVESAVGFLNGSRRAAGARLDVAGISMGGVVARIALARMEAAGRQHRVDNFLSIDAPQHQAVLQHSFVDFIQQQVNLGRIEAPKNLTSKAGRQLLEYNVYASSNESIAFFNEIDQINGNGYPHLSQNLGVSFGTRSSSPYLNQRWGRFEIRSWFGSLYQSQDFYITSEVAVPGSYLPLDVTKIWAYSCVQPWLGLCGNGKMLRYPPRHPTFIPTASALHEVNGQSRFDETMMASARSFHDRMPTELANRLLLWLGYQVPTLRVTASGSACIRNGYSGSYSATAFGGTGGYTYTWKMKPPCYGGGGGGGSLDSAPVGTNGPSCTGFNSIGTGQQTTYTPSSAHMPYGTLQILVEVRDSRNVKATSNTLYVSFVPDNGPDSCDSGSFGPDTPSASASSRALAEATPARSAPPPEVFTLEGGSPNPFSSSSEIAFGLPEDAPVRLAVYDLLGREVARPVEGLTSAGWHRVRLDGARLAAGVYLVRMEAGGRVLTTRITRVR